MPRVVVITAGLSVPSSSQLLGDRLGAALQAENADVEVTQVVLRDYASDLVNYLLTRVASPALGTVFAIVAEAAGLVVVTPVFSASYSGLFKMFFDALDEGVLEAMPVVLAATGGTPRHSLVPAQAMLPLFHYLKASVVPTTVYAATEDWGAADTGLQARIDRAASDLLAAVAHAPRRKVTDEFDVVDFERLLGN